MSDSPPQLSVIIPLHNGANHATTFVSQFEGHDYDPAEVEFVVVDDASDDGGADRFEQVLSPLGRVTRLSTGSTLGPGAARNLGLRFAAAPYVAFWDADDSPNLLVFLTLISRMNRAGTPIGSTGYSVMKLPRREVVEEFIPDSSVVSVDLLATRAGVWRFAFSRDFLTREGIRFPSASLGEDVQFLLDALERHGRVVTTVQEVGYTYYWHQGNSLSGRASPFDYAQLLVQLISSGRSYTVPAVRATSANWTVRVWLRCGLGAKLRSAPKLTALVARVVLSGQLDRLLAQLRQAGHTRLK
jgi:glycosyltransferase involved in cell wall biosynthesis